MRDAPDATSRGADVVKPAPFDYAAPETFEEAIGLKADAGDDALVLAGGQSLIPLLALRLATPALLIDLNRIGGLDSIRREEGWLTVGAMTRHRDAEEAVELGERIPILSDALPLIGHRAIRNRGTVGGSIAHADPAAEWPGLALALDATVGVDGPNGSRSIAAEDFFVGPFTNALGPDELVRAIRFRLPGSGSGSAFVEHSRRYGDFALVGVAVVVDVGTEGVVSEARIALIGVGGTAVRIRDGEHALEGGSLTDHEIAAAEAACRAAVDPPSSVHASSGYRRHLVGVLVGRAVRLARDRARAA
jgi:aerobic carbon-monoxide dehydrogenase medium subunit